MSSTGSQASLFRASPPELCLSATRYEIWNLCRMLGMRDRQKPLSAAPWDGLQMAMRHLERQGRRLRKADRVADQESP